LLDRRLSLARRELIQKTVLGSLNRAGETIARVEVAGVVSWRLV
jgi:hypothetical protein